MATCPQTCHELGSVHAVLPRACSCEHRPASGQIGTNASDKRVVQYRQKASQVKERLDSLKCSVNRSNSTSPQVGEKQDSYKERLIGEVPRAYEQAFKFEHDMEMEVEFDDESADIAAGIAAVNLSGTRKANLRALWSNALIIKVIGKIVGYQFLTSRISNLWKPSGRLDCVDLERDFFLVLFLLKVDYERVLREGPWFVGGHYLSVRKWEPNFKPATASVSLVAIWVQLPQLPIEYCEPSVLRDLGQAIGLLLRIDTHTASETRGRFARICVQVNLENPFIKLIKIDGIEQLVQYKGINALYFSYGRVGHKQLLSQQAEVSAIVVDRTTKKVDKGKKIWVLAHPLAKHQTRAPRATQKHLMLAKMKESRLDHSLERKVANPGSSNGTKPCTPKEKEAITHDDQTLKEGDEVMCTKGSAEDSMAIASLKISNAVLKKINRKLRAFKAVA
nr:hypothetical protein CFP56_66224 [Quercus suber]